MDDTQSISTYPNENDIIPPTRAQKLLKRGGWIFYGVICLIFFTLWKLPQDKIKGYIDGTIASILAPNGMSLTAGKTSLSFPFGFTYTMKEVTLNLPPPILPVKLDRVQVTPSILGLLMGKAGGKFEIAQGKGELGGSIALKKSNFSVSFYSDSFDLGKLGAVQFLTGLQGSGILTGDGKISGDLNIPSTLTGNTSIQMSKIIIEPQLIAGFSLPRLEISEGAVEVVFDKSKATFKTFKLGKPSNVNDDIRATLSGDITLGKQWPMSSLNLKTQFSLSDKVFRSIVLLDAILGPGKQTDGSYAFNIGGTIAAPFPAPVPAGK